MPGQRSGDEPRAVPREAEEKGGGAKGRDGAHRMVLRPAETQLRGAEEGKCYVPCRTRNETDANDVFQIRSVAPEYGSNHVAGGEDIALSTSKRVYVSFEAVDNATEYIFCLGLLRIGLVMLCEVFHPPSSPPAGASCMAVESWYIVTGNFAWLTCGLGSVRPPGTRHNIRSIS